VDGFGSHVVTDVSTLDPAQDESLGEVGCLRPPGVLEFALRAS
jgi:hypothetical protein